MAKRKPPRLVLRDIGDIEYCVLDALFRVDSLSGVYSLTHAQMISLKNSLGCRGVLVQCGRRVGILLDAPHRGRGKPVTLVGED